MHPTVLSLRGNTSRPSWKTRPAAEALETRIVPYALTGDAWPHANLVTIGFVPDGTDLGGVSSNLFAKFNAKWSTSCWQNQILRAAQVWAQQANLNFTVITDGGAPIGSGNYEQGDPTRADIRIGGYNFGTNTLAAAYLPPQGNNYSIAGDIAFNTGQAFNIGATYDLFTVAAHEFGHALGLLHSGVTNAAMYSAYTAQKAGLNGDDISGIQAIYGARPPASGNNSYSTAANLSGSISPSSLTAVITGLNLSTTAEQDYYTFTAPPGSSSSLRLAVQSSGLSLLAPAVTVYAADQCTVLGAATGSGALGSTLSLTVNGIAKGQVFYVKVAAANTSAFGTGAYALTLNFGTGPSPAVPLPDTQTAAGSTPSTQGTGANGAFVPCNFLTNSLLNTVAGVTSGFSADTGARFWVDDEIHSDQFAVAAALPARHAAPTAAPAAAPAGSPVCVVVPALIGTLAPQVTVGAVSFPLVAPPPVIPGVSAPIVTVTMPVGAASGVGSGVAADGQSANDYAPVGDGPTAQAVENIATTLLPMLLPPRPSELTTPETMNGLETTWPPPGPFQLVPDVDPPEGGGTIAPYDGDAGAAWSAVGAAAVLGGQCDLWRHNQRWHKRLARGKSVTTERRRMPRYPCWLTSYCWPLGGSWAERCQSVAEDISTQGVKLVLRQPFEPGTVLVMELQGTGAENPRRAVARVAHVCEPAPGVWELGCVFEHGVSEGQVRGLILGDLGQSPRPVG